jgi:transcription elongation factor Elf1
MITQIPCPVCKQIIVLNVDELLRGAKFQCANCGISISLSTDSREVVSDAVKKLEDLKMQSRNSFTD